MYTNFYTDEIGIKCKLEEINLIHSLLKHSFKKIINEDNLIKVYNKNYIIIIHFIEFTDKIYSNSFSKIKINKKKYNIPKNYDEIIRSNFHPNFKEIFKTVAINLNLFEKLFILIKLSIIFLLLKNKSRYEIKSKIFYHHKLLVSQSLLSFFTFIIKKKKIKKLTLKKFLNLTITKDKTNLKFRYKHYNIITKNQKFLKIFQIINYVKKNKKKIIKNICETNTKKLFTEPLYWNKIFWQTGNNFFINSMLYTFRKNIISYEKINNAKLIDNSYLKIFTKKYYSSKDIMSDDEIKLFLKKNPIIIKNDAVETGRHRVCAMIGRIIDNKPYIPFYYS